MNSVQEGLNQQAAELRSRNARKQAAYRARQPDWKATHREAQRKYRAAAKAAERRELAARIANDLFTNGSGEKADRLVLTSSQGHDLGGLCWSAVVNRIAEVIGNIPRKPEPPRGPVEAKAPTVSHAAASAFPRGGSGSLGAVT